MVYNLKRISLIIILACAALIPVITLALPEFSKSLSFTNAFLTGRIIQEGSYYCGEYSVITPVSANASSFLGPGFSADRAIDDNNLTRWVGNNSLPYPKWIAFDLGEKKCLNEINVYLAKIDVPIKMNVEVSEDGSTWSTVVSNWEVAQSDSYQAYTFNEKRARFVKITQTEGNNTYGALAEFKVKAAPLILNETVAQKKCEDSDGGKNYTIKGIVTITNQTTASQKYEDGCFSDKGLYEYYCDNNGNIALETVSCEGVCLEGACSSQQPSLKNNTSSTPKEEESGFGESIPESQESKCAGDYELLTPRAALANSVFNNFRASNSIDGDPETHWFGDPEKNYPKWIAFDLGGTKCVNGVELEFFIWDVPITFDIQTSLDNKKWTTVQSNIIVSDGGKKIRKDFAETTARFIRIYEKEGKRTYGTLSEIQVNAAPYGEGMKKVSSLKVENVIGSPIPDKFYEIDGTRAFVEIDGKPIQAYF